MISEALTVKPDARYTAYGRTGPKFAGPLAQGVLDLGLLLFVKYSSLYPPRDPWTRALESPFFALGAHVSDSWLQNFRLASKITPK